MTGAMNIFHKTGWEVCHVEESWVITRSTRSWQTPGYYLFHVHPQRIVRYIECKHDMPEQVRFLFNLVQD